MITTLWFKSCNRNAEYVPDDPPPTITKSRVITDSGRESIATAPVRINEAKTALAVVIENIMFAPGFNGLVEWNRAYQYSFALYSL
jgi:hypothetical protein